MISDPFRAPESNTKTLRRRTQKCVLEELVSQTLDCKIREGNHNRARCAYLLESPGWRTLTFQAPPSPVPRAASA